MRVAFMMDALRMEFAFGDGELRALGEEFELDEVPVSSVSELERPETVDLLLMGWGSDRLTRADLDAMPRLRGIVHFGGGFSDQTEATRRGIAVATAKAINAVPVAEYTLAMVTLAAKDVFWASRAYCVQQRFFDREVEFPRTGLRDDTVGVIGASTIGELVIRGLGERGANTAVYDPTVADDRIRELGAFRAHDLERLAAASRILTVHAPDVPATRGMVSARVLAAMPDGATLINTARGALVDQDALVEELRSGRLTAILDVTEPDPLPEGHPLYELPNVLLTPHMAGAMGSEIRTLGAAATEEALRFARGKRFAQPVGA